MSDDDSFFGRWSRRKRATEGAQPAAAPAPPPDPASPPDVAVAPEMLSEEELAALPRIEDLTEGSDITAFLRPGVPRALKNAARRKIWMATPAIRDYRDPAVDYAWDWNTPGGVPGDGCAPSPERAARMLRDLLAPPEPAPDEAMPAGEPALAQSDTPAMPVAEDAPEGAVPDQVPSALAVSGETPMQVGQVSAPSPLRRRHGGALPG